jgi:hypothetical protein
VRASPRVLWMAIAVLLLGLVVLLVALIWLLANPGARTGVEDEKAGPPEQQEKAQTQPAASDLSLGDTYEGVASGVSVTVEEPVRIDESPGQTTVSGKRKEAEKGKKMPLLPSLLTTESALIFEVTVSNEGEAPLILRQDAFTLETAEGARLQPIIHASFVGSSDDNLGEYQPGQERTSLVGFEVWDEAEDLVLVFRPQGDARVASWEVGAVEDFPPYSGVLPGEPRRELSEENKAKV